MVKKDETDHKPGTGAVRKFWDEYPLYAGESKFVVGEKAFFEEHRRISYFEHSGLLEPIFLHDVKAGNKIADIGCGIGFWIQELNELGGDIQASDLSENSAALTQKRINLYGLKADVIVANAEELPYAPSIFDHVNCQGVIHHTPDGAACIREFHRILKPGGTACFSVYYKLGLFGHPIIFKLVAALARPLMHVRGRGRENLLRAGNPEELVRMYDGSDNPIGKAFSDAELLEMTRKYFKVIEVKRTGFPRRAFAMPLSDELHRFLSHHFGLMIVMRCVKI